jgi:MIP family channel proteins
LNKGKFPCSNCKKECISELVGTYVLILIGPASVILATLFVPGRLAVESLVFVAFSFGATVAMVIIAFGKHSGALINPAVTVAIATAQLLKRHLFIPYLFFQILGGVLAGLTLRELFTSSVATTSLGSTKLASGINPVTGITIEALGTFILASSALIASTRIKRASGQALVVGTTLFLLILMIGPLTGAGFNPARSLGPSLASGYIENLYVYLIGPVLGALVAGLAFRLLLKEHGRKREKRNFVCLC